MSDEPKKDIVPQEDVIPEELRQHIKDDDPRNIYALGFQNLTKEEMQEMSQRGVAARRANRRARQLAQLEAYTQAHRELASQILGTKMTVLDGLLEEMKDEETGKLDTSRLDDGRLKVLLALTKQLEERAFGSVTQKSESKQTVDIRAAVVDLTKALQRPDTV
jgi:hypothetical protein